MSATYTQTVCILVQTTDSTSLYGVPTLAPSDRIKSTHRAKVDLAAFLERVAMGSGVGQVQVFVEAADGTKATGTATVGVGNASAGDTVVLGGVTFTFAATSDPAVLTTVTLGSTPLLSATNLVNKANLHPTVRGIGSLAVSGTTTGIATWTANIPTQAANTYGTIAVTGANLTCSGATMASGTESTFAGAGFFPGDGS